MKKLTRERVVPTISASVSWDTLGSTPSVPDSGRHLVNVLQKSAPRNESERAASNK